VRDLIAAFQFLTVFPLEWARLSLDNVERGEEGSAESAPDFARAMAYFPVVGAVQGLILVIAFKLFATHLPLSVASALVLAVLTLTNYGFHLDGFADTLDGLAGGKTKEDCLRIMRDGNIGPIGVTGLVVFLIMEYTSLLALSNAGLYSAIFLFPVVARWSMVPMSFFSNYAREGAGLGRSFSKASSRILIISTAITVIPAFMLLGPKALIMLAFIALAAYITSLYFKKKLNGVTGDIFGFQSETSGLIFMLLVLVSIH